MMTVEKTGILLSQSNAFLRKIEYNSHGFTGFLVFLKNSVNSPCLRWFTDVFQKI